MMKGYIWYSSVLEIESRIEERMEGGKNQNGITHTHIHTKILDYFCHDLSGSCLFDNESKNCQLGWFLWIWHVC